MPVEKGRLSCDDSEKRLLEAAVKESEEVAARSEVDQPGCCDHSDSQRWEVTKWFQLGTENCRIFWLLPLT